MTHSCKGCRERHHHHIPALRVIQKETFGNLLSRCGEIDELENFRIRWRLDYREPSVIILKKRTNEEVATIFFDKCGEEIIRFTGNLGRLKDIPGNPFKEFCETQKRTKRKKQKSPKGIILDDIFKCHIQDGRMIWRPVD